MENQYQLFNRSNRNDDEARFVWMRKYIFSSQRDESIHRIVKIISATSLDDELIQLENILLLRVQLAGETKTLTNLPPALSVWKHFYSHIETDFVIFHTCVSEYIFLSAKQISCHHKWIMGMNFRVGKKVWIYAMTERDTISKIKTFCCCESVEKYFHVSHKLIFTNWRLIWNWARSDDIWSHTQKAERNPSELWDENFMFCKAPKKFYQIHFKRIQLALCSMLMDCYFPVTPNINRTQIGIKLGQTW